MAKDVDMMLKFIGQQLKVNETIDAIDKRLAGMEKKLKGTGDEATMTGKKVEKSSDMMAKAMKLVSAAAVLYIGKKMFDAFRGAVNAAASFEKKISEVSTLLAGNASRQIGQYEKAIRKLATQTSSNVEELTSGLYQAISAGVKGTESVRSSMELLETAQKAAVAGVSDTNSAVTLLASSLNAYGASADQSKDYADALFTTVRLGVTTFGQLASGLGQVNSIAATAGITFDEVNAAVATLTKSGVQTENAITYLRSTIAAFLNPSKEMKNLLKDMGFESGSAAIKAKGFLGVMQMLNKSTGGNAEALKKLTPDMRAFAGTAVLAGTGIDNLAMIMGEMKNKSGAADEAYGKMADTFDERTKKFWNLIHDFVIELGDRLAPMLVEAMNSISDWIDLHGEDVKLFIAGIAGSIRELVDFVVEAARGIAIIAEFIGSSPARAAKERVAKGVKGMMAGLPEKGRNILEKLAKDPKSALKAIFPGMPEEEGPALGATTFGLKSSKEILEEIENKEKERQEAAKKAAEELADEIKKDDEEREKRLKKLLKEREKAEVMLAKLRIESQEGITKLRMKHQQEFLEVAAMAWKTEEQRQEALHALKKVQNKEIEKFYDDLAKKRKVEEEKIQKEREANEKRIADIRDSVTKKLLIDYRRIGGAELETAGERAYYAQYEGGAEESRAGEITKGFMRQAGASMYQFLMDLIGKLLSSDAVQGVQDLFNGLAERIENIADQIGPAIDWVLDTGIPMIVDKMNENLPKIISAIIERIPDIMESAAEQTPRIIDAIIDMIPEIAIKFVTALIEAIGKFFSKGISGVMGGTGGTTSRVGVGVLTGGVSEVWNAIFHQGGMIRDLTNAIRAHSGMFVGSGGLGQDEVPIVAQVGEAVLSRQGVAAAGGESGVNALNSGEAAGGVTINNVINAQHMFSRSSAEVIDEMISDNIRRGYGGLVRRLEANTTRGFEPRRK